MTNLLRFATSVIALVAAGEAAAQNAASISIDSITANDQIAGVVRGVQPAELAELKVIVYVHTDQWYVHPYAGQGEGKSWAAVAPNGTWRLGTVKREFAADQIAALLVKKDYPQPAKVDTLHGIPSLAREVKTLTGTSD